MTSVLVQPTQTVWVRLLGGGVAAQVLHLPVAPHQGLERLAPALSVLDAPEARRVVRRAHQRQPLARRGAQRAPPCRANPCVEEEAVKDLRRTQRPSAREYQLLLRAPSARSRRDLGGAGDAPMTRGGGRIVKVSKSGFDPPKLFVAPGEVVRWVMEDAATAHRLVCDAFTKSYEPKTQGQSITHAFESTGEYVVRCAICKARGSVNVGGREAPPSENVRQLRDEMSAAEAEGAAQLASLGAYDGGSSSSDGDGDDDDEQERYAQARHERVWGRKSAAGASSPEDGATGGLRSASSSPDGERSPPPCPPPRPQTPPAPPPALEAADSILPTTGNKISAILSARTAARRGRAAPPAVRRDVTSAVPTRRSPSRRPMMPTPTPTALRQLRRPRRPLRRSPRSARCA